MRTAILFLVSAAIVRAGETHTITITLDDVHAKAIALYCEKEKSDITAVITARANDAIFAFGAAIAAEQFKMIVDREQRDDVGKPKPMLSAVISALELERAKVAAAAEKTTETPVEKP